MAGDKTFTTVYLGYQHFRWRAFPAGAIPCRIFQDRPFAIRADNTDGDERVR